MTQHNVAHSFSLAGSNGKDREKRKKKTCLLLLCIQAVLTLPYLLDLREIHPSRFVSGIPINDSNS